MAFTRPRGCATPIRIQIICRIYGRGFHIRYYHFTSLLSWNLWWYFTMVPSQHTMIHQLVRHLQPGWRSNAQQSARAKFSDGVFHCRNHGNCRVEHFGEPELCWVICLAECPVEDSAGIGRMICENGSCWI